MSDLLEKDELPPGFSYPLAFRRIFDLGLVNLEPWWLLSGETLRLRFQGLRARYPMRCLIPFARRTDNDDVACWDYSKGNRTVCIIHDFASEGWEQREEFPTFYDWFRQAIEDLIEFDDYSDQ